MKINIIVPTYNGGKIILDNMQSIINNLTGFDSITTIVIDSSSTDGTQDYLKTLPVDVITISSADFNHGGTRNLGVKLSHNADIVVFLTQDAILNNKKSIKNIIKAFDDPNVAVAYGRQLPHLDANPIATHARLFNYHANSYVADLDSKKTLGIKAVFNSNSFSAYRVSIFNQIQGFPSNTILSEDMYFAAKAVMAGYKIAYMSDAEVRHSHNYSPIDEFKRYFDIGVFHADESWIRKEFGGAGGEGKKYLVSEFKYLLKQAPLWLPRACVTNVFKILGYKLGQNYKKIPLNIVKKCSMHKNFWKKKE